MQDGSPQVPPETSPADGPPADGAPFAGAPTAGMAHSSPSHDPGAGPSAKPVDVVAAAWRARGRERILGLALVGLTFVTAIGLSYASKVLATPVESVPPAPATTVGVPGFPTAVDVMEVLKIAPSFTKRPLLRCFLVEKVKVDGTQDVTTGPIYFSFQSPSGQGAQPPRAMGQLAHRRFCGMQRVRVKADGIAAEPDISDYQCNEPVVAAPIPNCGPRELWQTAIKKGAPTNQPARMEYYRAANGMAWRVMIPNFPPFVVATDCVTDLTPEQAAGILQ